MLHDYLFVGRRKSTTTTRTRTLTGARREMICVTADAMMLMTGCRVWRRRSLPSIVAERRCPSPVDPPPSKPMTRCDPRPTRQSALEARRVRRSGWVERRRRRRRIGIRRISASTVRARRLSLWTASEDAAVCTRGVHSRVPRQEDVDPPRERRRRRQTDGRPSLVPTPPAATCSRSPS